MPNKDKQYTLTVNEEIMKQMNELSRHSTKESIEISTTHSNNNTIMTNYFDKKLNNVNKKPTKIVRERLEATIEFTENSIAMRAKPWLYNKT